MIDADTSASACGALHGVVVVDKPAGVTSAEVIRQVERRLVGGRRGGRGRTRGRPRGATKIGHTGTLDPMATGVLPLCLGEATKLAQFLLADDKVYEAELELGVDTDTHDADGQVTARRPEAAAAVTRDALLAALAGRRGAGEQVPPMFSAIKRDGVRLHALARDGVVVERPPRPIVLHALDLLGFDPPRARVHVACSKGTYVRALARDLGQDLGCGAHLTALRRVRSGRFDLENALKLDEINEKSVRAALLSPAAVMAHLPRATASAEHVPAIANGAQLAWEVVAPPGDSEGRAGPPPPDALVCVLTPAGALLALVRVESGRLRYERVFRHGLTNSPDSSKVPRSKP